MSHHSQGVCPAAGPATTRAAPLPPKPRPRPRPRALSYQVLLTWAFTFFGSVRVISYLPTLWVIAQHQDSSQHSLLTWLTWLGANATMAAWLYEQNGSRLDRSVIVNLANAAMCAATVALIAWHRF